MSLIPSSATPLHLNLPLFNSTVLASSALRKEEKNEENSEENERRKWRMIGKRGEEGTSEEENGEDEEDEEEGEKKKNEEKKWKMTNGSEQKQREDGAVHAAQHQQQQQRQQQQHMDIPTIAFQLLHQAMIRNESIQQNRENEKLAIFRPSPSALADGRFAPQRVSNATKFKKSGGTHSSSAANGRRSANKSSISAATTAALMAPCPLGANPAIPGALAVAASPAAQLFREDDWSWHRNPAAAIRSGGTNKQTPVWKYFVYNKAENLSRCIVGNCTYQLKGPHTSTLACHLKKHAAEYAEFQRLKNEYTRERIVNGQTSSGSSAGGERSASARSTPFAAHSSSVGILPNGTTVGDDCSSQKSRSPSVLSDPFPTQYTKSSNASSPVLNLLNGRFANCGVLEDEQNGRNLLPRGMPPVSQPPPPAGDNGIFGVHSSHLHPLGGHQPPPHHFTPSPFQHFLIAAAAMAGQNNGIMQQRFTSPPPQHLDYLAMAQIGKTPKKMDQLETNAAEGEVGQNQQHTNQRQNGEASFCAHPPMKRDGGTAEGSAKGGTCGNGTGANLLDILNLLSKRAEAAASKEKGQNKEGEETEEREEEEGRTMKRKCMIKRESDEQEMQRQWREDGVRNETLEGREKEEKTTTEEEQTQTHLNHSVEHILKDEEEKEGEELPKKRVKTEEEEKEETMGMEEESADFQLSPRDRLALFLGTAFPPMALRHLMTDNPFLRHFCSSLGSESALTFESVDKLMDNHFARMKEQIRRKLARIRSSVLLVDIRCGRCWRFRQNAEELEHQKSDECQCRKGTDTDSICTITLHHKKAENSPILLAMRRIREELIEAEEKQSEKEADKVGKIGKMVEEVLSDYFSDSSAPSWPSLLLFRPPFFLHFPSSICSIPCLPAIRPHCLQKRLLTILSKKLPMGQKGEHLAKECCPHRTTSKQIQAENNPLGFASTSTDRTNELDQSFCICDQKMVGHQQQKETMTSENDGAMAFEREPPLKKIIRLHEIISEKSHWIGSEEMDEALSAIRTEEFESNEGIVQRIGDELSKATKALNSLHKLGLTDVCLLLKNTLVGPLAIFGNVIEGDTEEWTERNAILLFNSRRKKKTNNGHD